MKFDPNSFEKKWQEKWEKDEIYKAENSSPKPPCFVVDMFPYPSGSSMHVGHPRGYVATDVYARFKRMNGFNVLHPMGWDAFGLPAEETAIANKEYPTVTVERNIERFKTQLMMMGLGYDWKREINTTDPQYYKHTQRIFLEFFRRGLAKNSMMTVNWCPDLGTVLANEDIVDGKSERGGFPVYQMPMRQWVLKITDYADRLVDDLELLPQWPEKVKNAQKNWIGRSEGHEFSFETSANVLIPIFTTRIETLPGATFLVLAPESKLVEQLLSSATNVDLVNKYIDQAKQKTDLDRQVTTEKTGVIIEGVTATNPFTKNQIPVVVADYVLNSYGTGAIMAVPAHDERDNEMAQVLNLPIVQVLDENEKIIIEGELYGKTISEGVEEISKLVNATSKKRYKIRDWVFSRQRFWGEPFPIVWIEGKQNYDSLQTTVLKDWLPQEPVSYTDGDKEFFALPVLPDFLSAMELPKVESYEPTGTMEGPLAGIDEWVNAFMNPNTGEIANESRSDQWVPVKRETNTMPQWAGSSWYWLRYMNHDNQAEPFSKESAKYWGPVNVYAGADHAVAHLIYARFWHKMMQDAGMVDFPEPFERLEFLGYILAADGSKISKRKGNSRSPEEIVTQVGADAFRLYEMAIGPFEKAIPWNDNGLVGSRRFLERVWKEATRVYEQKSESSDSKALAAIHKAIKKVGEDIETFKFNTAVSSMMICLNDIQDKTLTISDFNLFVSLLAPFAPYTTEELWSMSNSENSIHISNWPVFNSDLVQEETMILPIQINGKRRAEIEVSKDLTEDQIKEVALNTPEVKEKIGDSEIKKYVYVPGRIINIVI